jgi:hypothetical protein
VATQFHCVVQDPSDFNGLAPNDPIEEEVASTSTLPGHMEGTNARHDLVTNSRPGYVRTVCKVTNRPQERVAIKS